MRELEFYLINFAPWEYKLNVLDNGELRAYLYISLGWWELNIDIFNVLHKYQRQGYGKRIIEELRKYYTITWESTESARFFWEAVGAEFTSLSDFVVCKTTS
jgi:GNAT superfamily N-acetyltransferase